MFTVVPLFLVCAIFVSRTFSVSFLVYHCEAVFLSLILQIGVCIRSCDEDDLDEQSHMFASAAVCLFVGHQNLAEVHLPIVNIYWMAGAFSAMKGLPCTQIHHIGVNDDRALHAAPS